MWPNPQFSADLFTFTKKVLTGKLHFLRSVVHEYSNIQFAVMHRRSLPRVFLIVARNKARYFLMLSEDIERDQWHEMG